MQYISTRGDTPAMPFQDAVLTGLAPDGGLLVPEVIPDVRDELDDWRGLGFVELAARVMGKFIGDMSAEDLRALLERSYAHFDDPASSELARMLEVDVLKYAPETMTAEQRQQFFADGYLVLENVVDEAWLQRLRAATAELVALSRNVSESDERFVLEDGHSAATPRVRRLTSPVTHHPTFWDFASSPLMADVAAGYLL